jgi:hypothetical protein
LNTKKAEFDEKGTCSVAQGNQKERSILFPFYHFHFFYDSESLDTEGVNNLDYFKNFGKSKINLNT